MQTLKICFVGIGSIAQRHIRNLIVIGKEQNIKLQIDAFRTKRNTIEPNSITQNNLTNIYYHYEDVPNDYDVIFITNPTQKHYETLKLFEQKGKNFFIEKPVFSDENANIQELCLNKSKTYYVACPLRYTKIIQYIKENLNITDIYSVRCICSSYLPDWRPGYDYRKVYSAIKELGGGVEIDLIHEWDYVCYLFGFPQKVFSNITKVSDLEINTNDIAVYIGSYKNLVVELHLDYFGRKNIRKIQLFGKNKTIEADLLTGEIKFLCDGKEAIKIQLPEERDEYQREELRCFLNLILCKGENPNTILNAVKILRLAKGNAI